VTVSGWSFACHCGAPMLARDVVWQGEELKFATLTPTCKCDALGSVQHGRHEVGTDAEDAREPGRH
jgi:hypothetical protein